MAYLVREADEQLVREIEHWLSLSPENKARLDELEAAWVESGKLKIRPVVVDVDDAWSTLSAKMDADEQKSVSIAPKQQRVSFIQTFTRIAAVVVLAVGLWAIRDAILKPKLQMFASEERIEQLDLADGSRVSLNENTTIIVPNEFAEGTRELEIEGEAFFEIKPDKAKPFIVRADEAYIKVLGTSFNVKALEASRDVEVFVEEGMVKLYAIEELSNDTASVILTVGETGVYDRDTKEVMKVAETSAEVLFWLDKTLIFEETRLSRVFEILAISYEAEISVEDSTISNCELDATFKNEEIDYILEVIAITFGLEVEKTDQRSYYIKGEGCEQ